MRATTAQRTRTARIDPVEKSTNKVSTTPKMATKIPYKSAVMSSGAPSTTVAGIVVADPAFCVVVAVDVPLGVVDILAYSLRR
jgi:hypothetical protein